MAQEQPVHLIVEEGPDLGMEISVRPEGVRVGRSSNNDVVLKDPVMSRYHCRLFFKPGEGLWVEDLGSANNTLLNADPVRLIRMKPGDRLTLGDTTLKVVSDELPGASSGPLFGESEKKIFDSNPTPPSKFAPEPRQKQILAIVLVIFAIAAGLTIIALLQKPSHPGNDSRPGASEQTPPLDIFYEKIEASQKNIFRYELECTRGELSVQIDDLGNKRHVPKNQRKKVDADITRALLETIQQSDFFSLNESYKGGAPEVYDLYDLTITIGKKTHRVKVLNTIEPEQFRKVRETIEEFAQNEIGLAALALTPEKLLEMAKTAALLGRSLYDQREVKRENLAGAIRSLKETEWYLETIDPKPEYYAESIALRRDAERELDEIHNNHIFLAERAIKLKDWNEAALQLRIIIERIPDRSDERHREVQKKLIDVERHLKKK